jgi:hypothetical protein
MALMISVNAGITARFALGADLATLFASLK